MAARVRVRIVACVADGSGGNARTPTDRPQAVRRRRTPRAKIENEKALSSSLARSGRDERTRA